MQPINYGVEIEDPTKSFLSAFQTGSTIQDTRLKQEQQQQKIANEKLILQGLAKIRQPNATVEDVSNLAMILPKDQSETVIKAWQLKTDAQKQNALGQAGKVVSALFAGENDIAQQLISDQAVAMRNSGNEEGAKFLETWRGVTEANPAASQNFFTAELLRLPGGDKIVENIVKMQADRREQQLAPAKLRQALATADKSESDAKIALANATTAPEIAVAEAALKKAQADKAKIESEYAGPLAQANLNLNAAQIKNINSEIGNRAAQLNLNRQTMQATVAEKLSNIQKNIGEVPADVRKIVNESAVTAAASKQSADQYNDLAKRLDAAGGGYGAATSFADYLRKTTGAQSPLTELRQEYTRIRNSAAIKSLPPGVATDKDIELALKGIPPENAKASTMASFLRGMGKMQDIDASVANAKTDWLASNNGVLTRAKNTFIAGDYAANPGETFNDFTQRIVKDVSKKYRPPEQVAEERRQQAVGQIPTNAAPVAAPAAPNIRSQADAILRGGK